MSCASCVARIERAAEQLPGVLDASVNLTTARASVRYVPGVVGPAQIADAVRLAGYDVGEAAPGPHWTDREREARERELKSYRRDLLTAAALTLPIFLLEMGVHLIPRLEEMVHALLHPQMLLHLVFALATVVQFGPGRRFYAKGWPALLRGAPDMNALVILGTSAAYAYSVVATFLPQALPAGTVHVYYEPSSVIITLILLGRYLEAIAKGRTSEAIRRLLGLQARNARGVSRWPRAECRNRVGQDG